MNDTFVFVISPDSVVSQVCDREINYALKHNKRLVPILHREIDFDQIHPQLAQLNWIIFREEDNFEQSFKSTLTEERSDPTKSCADQLIVSE